MLTFQNKEVEQAFKAKGLNLKKLQKKIDKLADILETTDRPKIRGSLIKLDGDSRSDEIVGKVKLDGYCVIGVFGCEKQMFNTLTVNQANQFHYNKILGAYGFSDLECALTVATSTKVFGVSDDYVRTLIEMFHNLNDYGTRKKPNGAYRGLTFKEIGKILRNLVITEGYART